eukprot:SAG31_NODE_35893_length_318_cov_1.187215_1_plen_82_part_10
MSDTNQRQIGVPTNCIKTSLWQESSDTLFSQWVASGVSEVKSKIMFKTNYDFHFNNYHCSLSTAMPISMISAVLGTSAMLEP